MSPEPATRNRPIRITTSYRALATAIAACLALGVAACGSDEPTAEEVFCEAGDSLQTDINALADLDLISEGTDGLKERFSIIESDLDQLRKSGSDVASEEISALETAVDDFGNAVNALGDDISVEGAQAAGTALTGITTAASGVFDKLSSTCD
jgi:hypothetical protein